MGGPQRRLPVGGHLPRSFRVEVQSQMEQLGAAVVVGVDGSEAALAAVFYGAGLAAERNRRVRVVCALSSRQRRRRTLPARRSELSLRPWTMRADVSMGECDGYRDLRQAGGDTHGR